MAGRPEVFQFHIAIEEIEPPVWRRIQVPSDSNFWDLHCAIQDAFGWLDCHLHEFQLGDAEPDLRVGIPDDEGSVEDDEVLPGWEVSLEDNVEEGETFLYVYDFGDSWVHQVKFEKICNAAPRKKYPVCLAGERACPPEDCGGPHGYGAFLKIILNPKHPEYRETLRWVGRQFDPESFDVKAVRFSDPAERLAVAELG